MPLEILICKSSAYFDRPSLFFPIILYLCHKYMVGILIKEYMIDFNLRFSGVAVGSGWQVLVAYINIGSYYIVGVPLGLIFGWYLHFGLEVHFLH